MHDEIEAYQRQWAYGEMPLKVNSYSEVNATYVLKVADAYNIADYKKLLDIGGNITKYTIINEAIYNRWFSTLDKNLIIGKTMGEILSSFNSVVPFEDFR